MMKHIVIFLLVLSQASVAENYPPHPPRDGGIIGNGKTIEFNNPLLGIQGHFPITWSSLDYGTGLALTHNDEKESFIGMRTEQIEGIHNLETLRSHLLLSYPNDDWTEIEWNNLPGLSNNSDSEKVFLLRNDDTIISIFYNVAQDHNSDINFILDSLEFAQ